MIHIPSKYAQVKRAYPGYFTDVTERQQRRVFSAKANYGLLTEVYSDGRGRYKLHNRGKTQWVTQKELIRVRRTKNTPLFYGKQETKINAHNSKKQAA